jgi:hypothetical protein
MSSARRIWNNVLALGAAAVVLMVGIVAIVTNVAVTNGESEQRYCLFAEPQAVGMLWLNSNNRSIKWFIQYTTDEIYKIWITGPTSSTTLIQLCGTPTPYACDASQPNVINGELVDNLKPQINAIRAQPVLYKLVFSTLSNLTVSMPLGMICGTAN